MYSIHEEWVRKGKDDWFRDQLKKMKFATRAERVPLDNFEKVISTMKIYRDKDRIEEITYRERQQVVREIRVREAKCSLKGKKTRMAGIWPRWHEREFWLCNEIGAQTPT